MLRLLGRRAVLGDLLDGAEVERLDAVASDRADLGNGLDDQDGVQQLAALPAVFGRDGDAGQPLLSQERQVLAREDAIILAGVGGRPEPAASELTSLCAVA